MTDPSRTLSDIPDEGDPAASRTTTPEHAPEPEPEPEAEREADNTSTDTSSRVVDGSRTTAAALGFPEGEPQSLHPAHLRTQLISHWIAVCVMSFAAFTILSGLTLGGALRGVSQ